MSPRTLSLLIAGVLGMGLLISAAASNVPYVALGPGPAYDTLGKMGPKPDDKQVIEITGRRTYPTTGRIDLTTVGVSDNLTFAQALLGWFDDDLAVIPREVVYPKNRKKKDIDQENAQQMRVSQDNATSAALRHLGIPITTEVKVDEIVPGSPAAGQLQPGDVLLFVDDVEVTDPAQLRDLTNSRAPGQSVRIGYRRGTDVAEVELTTVATTAPNQPTRAVIGVLTSAAVRYPFTVAISLKDVGGPSAGLSFALGIIDKLDPVDITGGRHVAGTGEIDPQGKVGPIGGITQKLIAAKRNGATVFLVPEDNCAEAVSDAPAGLQLLRVGTLREALVGLRILRDGGTPPLCSAA
ncbi:MAG TPA: S16 family serine protease [Mycobacteriales bacterium]|nr:S16 family serine protease [Mycobacteriales bacterium]